MRIALTLTILLPLTAFAQQPAAPTPNRFSVLYNARFFPQDTPRATLASLLKAGDLKQYDYIAAYLIDAKTSDALIAERAKDYLAAAEKDLRAERAKERADPFKPAPENRLPLDPAEFGKRVQAEATWRGYAQLVREVQERFVEDPAHLKELQRFLREGETTIDGETAKIAVKAEKGKAIYFRKVGNRWFVEDRTQPLAAAEPASKN